MRTLRNTLKLALLCLLFSSSVAAAGLAMAVAGLWLIVHDHVSVPADLARGQAVLDLQP